MSAFNTGGLRLDQGPPLSIPVSFFLTSALALAFAGGWIAVSAGFGLASVYTGQNAAIAHLGTVGLLMFTMVGALYQMLPVVAGAVVPKPRLAHLVHALMVAGTVALVMGQATFSPAPFAAAVALLSAGLLLFFVPAAGALFRTSVRSPTVSGMRVAFVGLAAVAFVGLRLAYARAGGAFPEQWLAWRFAHAHLGLLGWVGALICAISWQVVPMFYLAPELPRWAPRTIQLAVAASIVGLLGVFFAGLPLSLVPWMALPGAAAVWLLEPVMIGWSLRKRRRKRKDPSLWFWWLVVGVSPLCFAGGAASALTDVPWVPIAYGFVVLWGWAAALVHGMLTRIVPFLVWFHRCAPLLGKVEVASTKDLYPDRAVALGFGLHAGTLVVGLAAVVSDHPVVWRALGFGIAATALWLGFGLVRAVRRAPKPAVAAKA